MKKFISTLAFSLGLAGVAFADATVVFNEIHYHPATNEPAFEWIELRNQLAVDADISDWTISGDVDYRFPSNSIVRGGAFLVIALSPTNLIAASGATNVVGPFTGRLYNEDGTLRLKNNAGRKVDEINYGTEGDWPVAPDGSGVTLAKRDRDTASGPAANWTWSDQIGGTPGADNFPVNDGSGPDVRHIAFDSVWKYDATGIDLGIGWRAPGFIDSGWSSRSNLSSRSIPTLFNTGVDANKVVLANGATDTHYVLTATAQGTIGMNALAILNHPGWSANDAASSWDGVVNPGATSVAFGAYYFQTTFDLAGFIPSTVQVNMNMQADNQITNVMLNGTGLGFTFVGFAGFSPTFPITSGFTSGANSLEFRTLNDSTAANPGGFRALLSGSGLGVNTTAPLPVGPSTYYFRKSFNFSGDLAFTALRLSTLASDGAVFYLNGNEIYRQNLPGGAISYSTPALSDVTSPTVSGPLTIAASNLVVGVNVLAVEVHQAAGSADGPLLGAELISTPLPHPPSAPINIAFNEQSASTNAEFWLELHNFGTNSYPLGGAVLVLDGDTNEFVLPTVTLPSGGFLALTNTTFGFLPASGDKIYLYAPGKARVYDAFVVKKGPRARYPDGAGPWLHPDVPTAGTNNSFAFRSEIVINEIMYSHRSIPGTNGLPAQDSPEAWIELYNRGTNPVALTGWELDGGVRYNFAPGKTIAPGGYLVVADDVAHLRALYPAIDVIGNLRGKLSGRSDRILLVDPNGNPADEVLYFDGGCWPGYADGGGSSLELRDAWADNSKAEAWAASDETAKTGWQNYSYTMVAAASVTASPDATWRDFVLGLLAGGECLIDDISVIQASGAVQFISNGNFSGGQTGWRFVGNHNRSRVIPEPGNPGNNVLYLVATGPQEHMHNHIESTFSGANAVANGQTYTISYRAKHLAGNNLLNTRLYFNRCARTTALPVAALNGTPGAANSRAVGNTGPTFSQFGHTRVVPAAAEAVSVSVVAADAQGVASCEVRYSVNGAAFVPAPMTNTGGGIYLGVIPGQAASAIVQFYVRAVDGLGAAATFPAAGPDGGALYKVNDGQAMLSVAHNIRIVMTTANASFMHAPTNVMSNDLLPCTVIVDEKRAYYDAAVRLKSSQRGRNDAARVGFHLEFPPDDLFRGVHPVMLVDRSNVNSPQGEEILLRHAALRAGVPMPHAEICRVLAPQSAHTGTAIFAPRHEDEFIETAYENGGDGSLFELELIYYPTTADAGGYKLPQPDGVATLDFSDVGTNKEPYRYNFIIKNHRGEDDYSRFISFARSWSTPAGATLEPLTRLTTDWDEWMRSYAMVSLFSVSDMYTFGANSHNLLAYQRPSDGKLQYFMWDMDFSLTSGRGATAALIGGQNLGRILNATPSLQRCFYGYMLDQIDTVYNAGYMAYWVNRYDDFAPGASYAANTSLIQARADYARGQITTIAGNPAFAVNGPASITLSNNNLLTLTGTAPITAKTIKINGRDYALTWTSISAWTVRIPVEAGITTLVIAGYDVRGNILTNFIRTTTVNYTGVAPVAPGTVVINEIHYNPAIPNSGFLEIFNTSTNLAFDLSGWRLNGLSYTFPDGSILTNRGFVVLASDPVTYTVTYPTNTPAILGGYSGALQNGGETITLLKPGVYPALETVVDRVRYEGGAPWSADANGLGWSLQLIDAAQDNSRVSNWKSSQPGGGGPIDPWKTWTTNFNIGGNASNILFLYLDTAGSLDLDEISVIAQAGPTAGIDLVTNGGFEAPLAGTWAAAGVMANSFITDLVAASGTSALRLVSTGNGGPFTSNSFWQSIPLLTNLPYTLRARYLPTTNANNLIARINAVARPVLNVQPVPPPPPAPAATPSLTNNIASALPPYDPVWLNEIQPVNLTGPLDDVGDREPWVELHNAGTNAVDLSNYFLANNYFSNLSQWPFPAGSILGPGEFRVVWLDGETNETAGTSAHASFRPAAGSGTIALTRLVTGTPQITDYLTYTALPAGGSYGDFPDGQPFYRQNFYRATAGGTNDNLSAPLVVYINEWMAANTGTLLNQSNNNKYDDWFELHNPGDSPADLGGFWLTDNLSNIFMFRIPAGYTIPPHGFLHVWADAAPGLNTNTDPALHVSFKLDQNGDFIGLYGDDGLQVDCVTFSQQFNDIAEGRYPDGPDAQWIAPLTVATPAAPNALYANRYPFLAPLPVQTAYVGQPVNFLAPASDPDAPPQVLSFLLLDSPTNSAVNPATGALLWTPTAAQENSTNIVTYRVTDNGAPSLRAERSYTVIVRTQVILGGITAGPGGAISFTIGTIPGKTYRVEYKDDLNTVPWTTLPPDQVATGSTLTINDTIGANPQRFYRVQQRD